MNETLETTCPHCKKAIRLPLGRKFRCKRAGCGKDFTVEEVEPKLEQFALTGSDVSELTRPVPSGPKWAFWIPAAISVALAASVWSQPADIGFGGVTIIWLLISLPFWWLTLREYRAAATRRQRKHRLSIRADPRWLRLCEYQRAATEYSEFLAAVKRKEYKDLRANERWWRSLDGRRFERELATLYKERGYEVQGVGGPGDEGVDLILNKDGRKILVQCKAHRSQTPPAKRVA